jgi:hypothetical protein
MADDFLDQLGSAVASIAPTVATLLGGPLAGQGVQFLETQLGVTPPADATLAQRAQALVPAVGSASMDQALAIKKEDDALQAKLADAGIQLAQVDAGDRASARAREIAVRDPTPSVGFYMLTVGFFGLLGLLALRDVPAGSRDLLNIMIGILGSAWVGCTTYYYGSSAGSQAKDTTIAHLAKTP